MPAEPDSISFTPEPATMRSHCAETDAPSSAAEREATTSHRAEWLEGIAPTERPLLPGYDSAVVAMLLGVFMFVAVNFKHYSTYLKSMWQELLSVRRRANVFDDHTVSETRILVSLIIVVCFSEAVLLFSAIYGSGMSTLAVFPLLACLLGVTLGYYTLQLCAYSTVGNVFTDGQNARQWVKGFNASQAILGIVLIIPALVTLFYPALAQSMIALGAMLYLTARILFICKGFKIFYHNLFSLVYFILYLCALEIAPLVVVFRGRSLLN